jgi:hypothetical protein
MVSMVGQVAIESCWAAEPGDTNKRTFFPVLSCRYLCSLGSVMIITDSRNGEQLKWDLHELCC